MSGARRGCASAAALATVLLLAGALPGRWSAARADEPTARTSLPEHGRHDAWQLPGLRIGLAAGYGGVIGLGGAPGGHLVGGNLRVGVRLDARWSIYASFQYYGVVSGELTGLRYSGTLEPTWHIVRGLSLSAGMGFGGIVERGGSGREDPRPHAHGMPKSYTFPDASTPLPRCNGLGLAGVLRAEYRFRLGQRTSIGPALELLGQWTACVDESGSVDPRTGQLNVRRQWWPQLGLAASWIAVWR